MGETLPIEEVGTATADAQGVAVVRFGPVQAFETWQVGRVSVRSDSVLRSAVMVARNEPTAANQIDSAPYSGNDDTSDTVFSVRPGETLVIQWSGCTPGARCTTTLSGTKTRA